MSRFARYMATVFASALSFINGITNGNFASGTTGWLSYYGTSAASGGVLTNTAGAANAASILGKENASVTSGDKIYTRVRFRVTNADCTSLSAPCNFGSWVGAPAITPPTQNQWYEPSAILTATATTSGGLVRASHAYASGAVASGKQMEVDYCVYYNLTANGKADKDLAWCDANIVDPNIVW